MSNLRHEKGLEKASGFVYCSSCLPQLQKAKLQNLHLDDEKEHP